MKQYLKGLWQLSPLTDLSIPQNDIEFPAPLSQALPSSLSESSISAQEWHLMHDIEVDESMLAFPAIDLVVAGIDHYAEIRLNGVALFDCDGGQSEYKKDIRPYLQLGRNRFEILFIEEDEDLLLEEESADMCVLGEKHLKEKHRAVGVWAAPYLQFIRHVRLDHVTMEQIWHHGGGCEFKVDLFYHTLAAGLVSAAVKFDGMTYHVPIDVRAKHASVLFQVDAPRCLDPQKPNPADLYCLEVELDGQRQEFEVALRHDLCVTHVPL